MKTSIIYGPRLNNRACLPGEAPVQEEGSPHKFAYPTPRFVEAHYQEGEQLLGFGTPKPRLQHYREHVPDKIHIEHFAWALDGTHGLTIKPWKREGKTFAAYVISPEYTRALDELDQQIEALHASRAALMVEAAKRGRLLRLKDVEGE